MEELNLLAILGASVSRFALGGIWYGPAFGKPWMQETGMTEEKAKAGNMVKIFGLTFLASVIIAVTLAFFVGVNSSPLAGLCNGLTIGLGWVAMSMATNDLFEQRSIKLFAINAGYHTVAFAIMGTILGTWS